MSTRFGWYPTPHGLAAVAANGGLATPAAGADTRGTPGGRVREYEPSPTASGDDICLWLITGTTTMFGDGCVNTTEDRGFNVALVPLAKIEFALGGAGVASLDAGV